MVLAIDLNIAFIIINISSLIGGEWLAKFLAQQHPLLLMWVSVCPTYISDVSEGGVYWLLLKFLSFCGSVYSHQLLHIISASLSHHSFKAMPFEIYSSQYICHMVISCDFSLKYQNTFPSLPYLGDFSHYDGDFMTALKLTRLAF